MSSRTITIPELKVNTFMIRREENSHFRDGQPRRRQLLTSKIKIDTMKSMALHEKHVEAHANESKWPHPLIELDCFKN